MRVEVFRRISHGAVATAWAAIVAAGFVGLFRHSASSGAAGAPPPRRPPASLSASPPGVAHLMMFAHPRCPCLGASLAELARILARSGGSVQADVFFFRPAGSPESWARTAQWRAAEAIPGVRAIDDVGAGRLADSAS